MLKQKEHNGMTEHKCFDELVEKTGSDATFEVMIKHYSGEKSLYKWGINLYHYTPSLRISTKRGRLIINFCPICGEDLRDDLPPMPKTPEEHKALMASKEE